MKQTTGLTEDGLASATSFHSVLADLATLARDGHRHRDHAALSAHRADPASPGSARRRSTSWVLQTCPAAEG